MVWILVKFFLAVPMALAAGAGNDCAATANRPCLEELNPADPMTLKKAEMLRLDRTVREIARINRQRNNPHGLSPWMRFMDMNPQNVTAPPSRAERAEFSHFTPQFYLFDETSPDAIQVGQ